MSHSPITILPVDRYVLLPGITSNMAIMDALHQVSSSLHGIHNTEPLLDRLFESIVEVIPAERGTVLLSTSKPGALQPAGFRGSPFDVNPEIAAQVLRDGVAILTNVPNSNSVLCAPLRFFDSDLGVIYFEGKGPGVFTETHLHLLVAIAAVAAMELHYTRYVDNLEGENRQLREYASIDHGLVGDSPPMLELRNLITKVAASDSTALILGESGTGKELVARAIHANSRRSSGPYGAINCAAIVDTLIESELFGHERGAFSGAAAQKKGKVELADGGTFFLDEVGELTPQTQAALLRFLQEREFQRVGGTRTLKADVRIVAATNRNLKESIKQGSFREDLYYRLQVVELRTPSLREIPEDIPRLAQHFVERFRYIRVVKGISGEAREVLTQDEWPGNVRQLQNAIEHALVIGQSDLIEVEDLPESFMDVKSSEMRLASYSETMKQSQKELIERALQETGGNQTEAARILRISTRYLRRLVRKLNITLPN